MKRCCSVNIFVTPTFPVAESGGNNQTSSQEWNFIPNGIAHSILENEEENSNAVPESCDSRLESAEAINSEEHVNLVQKMIPSSSPLEGGTEFLIALGGVLLEDINYAYFGEHRVELKKFNTLNLTGIIPAAHQPGIVKVRVYSQSETFLGETEVRYIDLMNRVVSEAVQHGIEGVTKLYGLMGKHSIDWWKQSASVKQNPAFSSLTTSTASVESPTGTDTGETSSSSDIQDVIIVRDTEKKEKVFFFVMVHP